jgi:hypothetical protein
MRMTAEDIGREMPVGALTASFSILMIRIETAGAATQVRILRQEYSIFDFVPAIINPQIFAKQNRNPADWDFTGHWPVAAGG